MKTNDAKQELEQRAAAALKKVLTEVSTVRVSEIRRESDEGGLTVCVDVFGRRHTLACEVQSDGQAGRVRTALKELAFRGREAMPVIIAPYLSPEAQQLCKDSKTGFVDLEGNARLALGEVFIAKRTFGAHRGQHRSTAAWSVNRNASERLPQTSVSLGTPALRAEA
jgi:hypothetical protein